MVRASRALENPAPATWPDSRPLSPAQLPIWYAEMLHRDTPRWTQFSVTTLDGVVDRAKLDAALAATVAHYPALRTCLMRHKHGVRQVFHDASGFRVDWRDLSGLSAEVRERAVAAILAEGERYRFALHGHWLFRAEVLACAPDRFLLLLFMHHIAADGMCLPLVLQRVALAYRGETAGPAATTEEGDGQYERWLDRQSGPDFEATLEPTRTFYRRALAGATTWQERLYDQAENDAAPHEPPDLPESTCVLEPAVVQNLSRLAEQTASTLFIVCLAAYGVALGRVLGVQDLVIAVFVSGRGSESGLAAMAVNTLLVRLRLDGLTEAAALVRCAKEAWRPLRRFAAVPIHALRQPARAGSAADATGNDDGMPPSEPAAVPDRVQFAINFLDMRTMTFDLPGVASRTTYPQSAFPLNDMLLLLFREQDESLRLRLFNGSGTRRLGFGRLAAVADAMAGVLRAWSDEAQAVSPGTPRRGR